MAGSFFFLSIYGLKCRFCYIWVVRHRTVSQETSPLCKILTDVWTSNSFYQDPGTTLNHCCQITFALTLHRTPFFADGSHFKKFIFIFLKILLTFILFCDIIYIERKIKKEKNKSRSICR